MKEIPTPDQFFGQIKKKTKPQWSAAFFGGIVIGLLTHMYAMSHHFLTYDSMWNLYSNQDMISSGRQFLTFACKVSSYYDLPWINGLLAILFLSISAVIIVEAFGISKPFLAVLAAGILVTFPTISSTFCYTYTIDGYMLAVLLAVLAFYVTDRKKYGFFAGIVLMGVSIGIYQAYFSLTVVLCILKLFLDLLEEDKLSKIFGKVWRYLVMGVGGYAFYVITLKIMLKVKDVQISGYQGTDKIGSLSLSQIPQGLKTAFYTFLDFARYSNVLTTTNVMKYAFVGMLLVTIGIFIHLFIYKRRWKSPLRIAFLLILAAFLPFGATLVSILSPDTYFHLLMRLPWALFFIFTLVMLERFMETWCFDAVVLDSNHARKDENGKSIKERLRNIWGKIVSAIGLICSVVMIFEFAVAANIVYFNMNERYEKTYAACVRIIDRLEQTPGYETGMKVAILGGVLDSQFYPATDITAKDLVGYFGVNGELCVNDTAKYAEFCSHYLNVTLVTIPGEEEIELTQTEEFIHMSKFPKDGCIQRIGDVWVIKLNG